MGDFAPPSSQLGQPLLGDLNVTPQPTAGQGVALDATGQLPLAVRKLLPGYVLASTLLTTASTPIASTTEASPTTVMTAPAVTVDGGTAISIEVFVPQLNAPTTAATNSTSLSLYEGSTELGIIAAVSCQVAGVSNILPVRTSYQFTPTAGTHTYFVGGWCGGSATNASVVAGTGGTGNRVPAFIRVVRA